MTPFLPHTPWMAFLAGLLLAAGLAVVAARMLGARGWMDHPEGRKLHARPTPRTAGIAFLLALGVLSALKVIELPLQPLQWVGVAVMGFLGALDDRSPLAAKPKAMVGFLVALMLAMDLGTRLAVSGAPLHFAGLQVPNQAVCTVPLLTLWFWSIPQAFNLMDGLDGLALGFLALALYASGLVFAQGTAAFWGIWAAIFLMNYPRAHHFLGDAGTLGLGTLLSIVVIHGTLPGDAGMSLWICAYLVVDVTAVVYSRWRDRRPLGTGDRSHLHHGVQDVWGVRALLGTPLLLALVALTSLRVRPEPWADYLAEMGLVLMMGMGVYFRRVLVRGKVDRLRPVNAPDGLRMKPPAVV